MVCLNVQEEEEEEEEKNYSLFSIGQRQLGQLPKTNVDLIDWCYMVRNK